MPRIDLDILNQKQTPAFYASSLATRPAAGFVGRIFIDSDNPSTGLYRDTGSSWIQIADAGAGSSGTLQQVTTNGNTSNVGISITANGIGIGTTIPATNRLDIHAASGIQATFNGTGTTNSALQFQLAGTGKWNIGNLYNSAANDFIITDVLNTLNRITIKNTGQTFIGADTTSSGLFVVNSATSDNHIVILGANAPSLRFRNAGTGGTLNTGLGISTATNNFIQGSASGDYCIFNSSTTASPILFGVYNSGAAQTQEAARISAARNFIVGSVTDTGEKLQITGNAVITGTLTTGSPLSIKDASPFIRWQNASGTRLAYIQHNATNLNYNADTGIHYFGQAIQVESNITLANDIIWSNNSGYGLKGYDGVRFLDYTSAGLNLGYLAAKTTVYGNNIAALTAKSSGIINLSNTPVYASNALAIAGGLVVGDLYKNSIGVLSIVY